MDFLLLYIKSAINVFSYLSDPILCAVIYHPPNPNSCFLCEFSEFVSSIILSIVRIVICDTYILIISHMMTPSYLNSKPYLISPSMSVSPPNVVGIHLIWVMLKGLCVANVSMIDFTFCHALLLAPTNTHKHKRNYCCNKRSLNIKTQNTFSELVTTSNLSTYKQLSKLNGQGFFQKQPE